MRRSLVIVDTQTANLASLLAAFRRLGCKVTVSAEVETIDRAACLVLPGVGSFATGMTRLRERDLLEPLRSRLVSGRPTLGVCLGMQLLCAASEESPGVEGLGAIPAAVRRFASDLVTPHMGWNSVRPSPEAVDEGLITCGAAYFANSYRLTDAPAGWSSAHTDYGGLFVSALWRGAILGCQFHPELSGRWGSDLLDRWLSLSVRAATEQGVNACS